jgi:hypothetical protein
MRTGYLKYRIEIGAGQVHAYSNAPNALGERFGGINTCNFGPFGLIDADLVEDRRELVSIFCHIDLLGVRSKDLDTVLLETQCNVLW